MAGSRRKLLAGAASGVAAVTVAALPAVAVEVSNGASTPSPLRLLAGRIKAAEQRMDAAEEAWAEAFQSVRPADYSFTAEDHERWREIAREAFPGPHAEQVEAERDWRALLDEMVGAPCACLGDLDAKLGHLVELLASDEPGEDEILARTALDGLRRLAGGPAHA